MLAPVEFEHRIFTVNEAAEHLRVSRAFIYSLISEKRLQPIKAGRRTLLTGGELMRFISGCRGE